MKIAVCITTRNRTEVFGKGLAMQRAYLPKGARIFVVDDNSTEPVAETQPVLEDETWYYAEKKLGIPRAKNKCLELAMEWGAHHIFLFDDDTWPLQRPWANKYIKNKEPHLFYVFVNKGNQTRTFGLEGMDKDNDLRWFNHTRGCMLYFESDVIETVGGFDPIFGDGGYEHTELSDRIHAAGFTTHAYQDAIDTDKYIYSSDEFDAVESTFTANERRKFIIKNKPIKIKLRGRTDFIDYK